MKFAIAFVFLALVCSSQVWAWDFVNPFEDAIADLPKPADLPKIETDLPKITTDNINQAKETLQSALNNGEQQLSGITKNLMNFAEGAINKFQNVIGNIVKNTEDRLKKMTEDAEVQGIDVSECKKKVNTLRAAAGHALQDAFSCVSKKTDEAKSLTAKSLNLGKETLIQMTQMQNKLVDCAKNSGDLVAKISAAGCLTSVGTTSIVSLTAKVPSIIENIAETTKFVGTLQLSLPTCASTKAIEAVTKKSSAVIAKTQSCIAEIIGMKKIQKTDQTAEKNQKEKQTTEMNQRETQPTETTNNGLFGQIGNGVGSFLKNIFG